MSIAVLLLKDRQALNVDKLPKIFPMPTNAGGAVDATGPSLVDGTLGPLFDGFCSGKWILHC
ncbi:hypothetical protein POPTR_003G096850v4 [Populus trichocarpa]|uniref:Uncharacterized protein n=1 Tax=Populus trichocarpa TaxID=3694 RepID=A0ACC0T9B2_POPTR|nr:hypothetical protein POPTR_003G096850v4 [Populus trichocarpa]